MEFEVRADVLTRSVMGFLRREGWFDALCMLIAEAGHGERELGRELQIIEQLGVTGRWEELLRYMEPLRRQCKEFSGVEFAVKKQQYLEALSWQGGLDCPSEQAPWRPLREFVNNSSTEDLGEIDMDQVVEVLKSLEHLCSQEEFNRLCNCLTYKNLRESPDFNHWRMSKGRLDCICSIHRILSPVLTGNKFEFADENESSLLNSLAFGMEYQVEQAANSLRGGRERKEFYDRMPPRIPIKTRLCSNRFEEILSPDLLDVQASMMEYPKMYVSSTTTAVAESKPSHHSTDSYWQTNEKDTEGTSQAAITPAVKSTIPESWHQGTRHDGPPQTKPPVSWTVNANNDLANQNDTRGDTATKPNDKEREQRGESWSIDFSGTKADTVKVKNYPSASSSPSRRRSPRRGHHFSTHIEDDATTTTLDTHEMSQDTMGTKRIERKETLKEVEASGSQLPPKPLVSKVALSRHCFGDGGWTAVADASLEQASIVTPVQLLRDSNPLRCVSVQPNVAACHDGGVVDSLAMDGNSSGSEITLAVGSNAKSVTIMDVKRPSNNIDIRHELQGVHRGSVYSCDWSTDGKVLATGSNDKAIRIIRNIPSQQHGKQEISSSLLKGHNGTVRCVKFNLSDPCVLASGGAGDCRVRLWDVATEHVHGIYWVNRSLLLSGCDAGLLLAHDTRTASVAWSVSLSSHGICHMSSFVDNLLLSGHANGEVNVFDIRIRRKLYSCTLHNSDVRSVAMWTEPVGMGSSRMMDTGSSNLFGLTTSYDGSGAIWKLNPQSSSGETSSQGFDLIKVARLMGHTDKILSSSYCPWTHDVITSGADGNVFMWSPEACVNSGR